jgi:hypothetical protein
VGAWRLFDFVGQAQRTSGEAREERGRRRAADGNDEVVDEGVGEPVAVMSTFGSMGEKGEILMAFIGTKLSQRWVTLFQFAVHFARVRLSAAVMKFVGMNLSHALKAHYAQHLDR